MSSRLWVLVLVLLAAVGLACKEGPPSDICVINADNPHLSSTDLAKGTFTIIGKGWFKCTKSPREITVYVELQRRTIGVWATMDQRSSKFTNPPAGKKSKDVVMRPLALTDAFGPAPAPAGPMKWETLLNKRNGACPPRLWTHVRRARRDE